MKIKLKLETERLIVKILSLKDAESYSKLGVSYRSTGKINNTQKAEEYIKKSHKSKDSFDLGIFLKENKKLIGTIELCHMNWFDFKAGEISYTIHKEHRKKGYVTEAIEPLIDYCFKNMKFIKIYADTEPNNIASNKVLKKLNFKLEGRIRKRHLKKGKWVDELDYGLLKEEWRNKKGRRN